MSPAEPAPLLIVASLGVALVVLLITWLRLPAFIALATGSVFVGVAARMPGAEIPRAFQQGMGDTLGFVAMVIGLGTIIGRLLAESGGAVVVSRALTTGLGKGRLDWAVMLSAFVIGPWRRPPCSTGRCAARLNSPAARSSRCWWRLCLRSSRLAARAASTAPICCASQRTRSRPSLPCCSSSAQAAASAVS